MNENRVLQIDSSDIEEGKKFLKVFNIDGVMIYVRGKKTGSIIHDITVDWLATTEHDVDKLIEIFHNTPLQQLKESGRVNHLGTLSMYPPGQILTDNLIFRS